MTNLSLILNLGFHTSRWQDTRSPLYQMDPLSMTCQIAYFLGPRTCRSLVTKRNRKPLFESFLLLFPSLKGANWLLLKAKYLFRRLQSKQNSLELLNAYSRGDNFWNPSWKIFVHHRCVRVMCVMMLCFWQASKLTVAKIINDTLWSSLNQLYK